MTVTPATPLELLPRPMPQNSRHQGAHHLDGGQLPIAPPNCGQAWRSGAAMPGGRARAWERSHRWTAVTCSPRGAAPGSGRKCGNRPSDGGQRQRSGISSDPLQAAAGRLAGRWPAPPARIHFRPPNCLPVMAPYPSGAQCQRSGPSPATISGVFAPACTSACARRRPQVPPRWRAGSASVSSAWTGRGPTRCRLSVRRPPWLLGTRR